MSSTASYSVMRSNIKAATMAILQGFHKGTAEALLPGTSESFMYHLHPASVDTKTMSRADFVDFWKAFMIPNLRNFQAELLWEVYDVESRRSTIYLTSSADSPLGENTYKNEVVFMCQFGEDGKTLERIDEMLDSASFNDFKARIEALGR